MPVVSTVLPVEARELSQQYVVYPSVLEGEVRLTGAKNNALRILAASMLTGDEVRITNYPGGLLDIRTHEQMLEALGKRCLHNDARDEVRISELETPGELVWEGRSIRNTLLVLAAKVARTGYGAVPLPGGCQIGTGGVRGIDLHELALHRFGARVWAKDDILYAEREGRATGADIDLPIRSNGATESALFLASLAEGTSRIWNPSIMLEVQETIRALRMMGAQIEVKGPQCIEVQGVDALGGCDIHIVEDDIEAATWTAAAAISGKPIEIEGFPREHMKIAVATLEEFGFGFHDQGGRRVLVTPGRYPMEIYAGPWPAIHTDMQPVLAAAATCITGRSRIVDMQMSGRFGYSNEMNRMGAQTSLDSGALEVFGGSPLKGAYVQALDLRAGAAVSLMGTRAQGVTVVEDAWQVARGYQDFPGKVRRLGGRIEVVYTADHPEQHRISP